MFQYATLYALGKEKNCDIGIPANDQSAEFYKDKASPLSLTQAFSNISASRIVEFDYVGRYEERTFEYSSNIFLLMDNCDIHGYFQSPHYFSAYKDDIKNEFLFCDEVQASAKKKVATSRSSTDKKVCAVHIRRTDYLDLPKFHTDLLATDYYSQAISYIAAKYNNPNFLIFSDNMEWCKNNLRFEEPFKVSFSTGETQTEDMCMITMCDYHIIANSSFSWWGAWLSQSEFTIAPAQWFGPDGPASWNTIYEQSWEVI